MEQKHRMTARSKDPAPYLYGNEREPHTRLMKHDERFATVSTWRPVGRIEGDSLYWRFITTEGQTVVVRPIQLPSNATPLCVPAEISSAMRVASWLIGLVHGHISVNGVDPNAPDKTERLKGIALYEINAFIGRTTGKKPVPVREPDKRVGYSTKGYAKIVQRLTDPKDSGAAKLETIRTFILHELFKDVPVMLDEARGLRGSRALLHQMHGKVDRTETYPPPGGFTRATIRDADLRRLVRFMGEQIGNDMTLPVLLAYNSAMPEMFNGWVMEMATARKIKSAAAKRFLAEHITFIAECEGRRFRHCYPIEDIMAQHDVMDQEDRAPYQIPVRYESEVIIAPTMAHANYEKTSKRGRPVETNRNQDEDLRKKYESMRATGRLFSHAEFAEAINEPLREVKPALERARKRRERDNIARQK